MRESARRAVGSTAATLVVLALAVAGALAYVHRQDISDHFRARAFDAPQEIAELADHLDLTQTGRRVFFASRPTLASSVEFSDQCSRVDHSDSGHVLGCYSEETIHLFAVDDPRLAGIVEVTGAHELLHAVWARLHAADRDRLSAELTACYEELVADDRELAERMAVYEHLSDAAFANELHSVLGTEVRDLPDGLERHYERWLADRSRIVDDFEAYHGVFVELERRAEELQAEMTALRADVEARRAAYEEAVERFNADASEFQRRNEAFEFSDDPSGFQAIYDELDRRRQELERTLADLEGDIARYEEMRDELKELSEQSAELDDRMSSDLERPEGQPAD